MARRRNVDDPTLDTPGLDVGAPDPSSSTPPPLTPAPPPKFTPQMRDQTVKGWETSSFSPDRAGIEQYLGTLGEGHGWTVLDNDKVKDPGGRTYDWIGNSGTAQAQKRSGYTTDPRYADVTGSKKGATLRLPSGSSSVRPVPAPINTSSSSSSMDDIGNELKKLFPSGLYNNQLVSDRTSSAADDLNRQRKSRMATNRAVLADRGLLGSGPEMTAMNRMEEDLYDQFTGSVRDIRADESSNADERMMLALTTAAGLSTDQARLVLDRFKAENEDKFNMGSLSLGHRNAGITETLGLGNLALGNLNATNSYNLGLGNLGLGRDTLNSGNTNTRVDQLIDLLEIYMRGAGITTEGAR